ncbi:hypothetical protein GCM10010508_18090 [Streptomyces naganishii JCM 4654]|uniref:Uncharacterized protein n=1 Tax=Streptomyces naganishii JCM 4654 TaxID=1306179 RepID=A0A918Y100_9ACTN|nr:hypothetical protein GCM10010508_18090 [Streptomyces naganishii JCM 4654]
MGALTVAGLAAVPAASPAACLVVRLLGAGYLVYLGAQTLWQHRRAGNVGTAEAPAAVPAGSPWRTGLVSNLQADHHPASRHPSPPIDYRLVPEPADPLTQLIRTESVNPISDLIPGGGGERAVTGFCGSHASGAANQWTVRSGIAGRTFSAMWRRTSSSGRAPDSLHTVKS